MDDSDINDIFKDFEHKVDSKKEAPKNERKRELSEEDELKESYKRAEQTLKEKYGEKKEALREKKAAEERKSEEKKPKEEIMPRHVLSKGIPNYERFGYIAVIVILVAYIGLGFFQGSDSAAQEQAVVAAVVKMEEPAGEQETGAAAEESGKEKQNETAGEAKAEKAAEEKKLSGKIAFALDEIDAQVVDADNDLGKIEKVVFTIENGKDNDLTPVVHVYAYDSELDKSWETISRGEYKGTAIKPGGKQRGSISLVPKTFRNLDIKKSIRLALNDTEDGFVASVNEDVLIE